MPVFPAFARNVLHLNMRYECSDSTSPYPHMLPPAEAFGKEMTRLGVRNSDAVVVYDGTPCFCIL